ncbi:MAG TPA: mycofactocin-associated electron transfer flavoprotein beta subunit [Acidimicrobiales bacterium]
MSAHPVPPDAPATTSGDGTGPLIVACLRINDLRPAVDPLDGSVTRDPLGVGLSPAEAAALEHALRLADAWGGRVLAVSVGPSSIEPVLREVAALGVTVVRVPADHESDGHRYVTELAEDEHALARTVAAAVRPFGPPDLVVCGDRSVDRGTGALPAYLAHELGASQALGLVALAAEGPGRLVVERRLDGGWRERLLVRLPAVCSVEGAGVRLRRASLAGTLAVAGVPTPVDRSLGVAEAAAPGSAPGPLHIGATRPYSPRTHVLPAPGGDDPRLRLLALTGALVAHEPPVVVHPADAAEAADVLLAFLSRHGYVDSDAGAAAAAGDGTP